VYFATVVKLSRYVDHCRLNVGPSSRSSAYRIGRRREKNFLGIVYGTHCSGNSGVSADFIVIEYTLDKSSRCVQQLKNGSTNRQ